jgi:hypothetical protein
MKQRIGGHLGLGPEGGAGCLAGWAEDAVDEDGAGA